VEYCRACLRVLVHGSYICVECLDPSKIKVVCQRCGLRKEISQEEACQLGDAGAYEPVIAMGTILIHSACNECAHPGEEIEITFMALRSAVN